MATFTAPARKPGLIQLSSCAGEWAVTAMLQNTPHVLQEKLKNKAIWNISVLLVSLFIYLLLSLKNNPDASQGSPQAHLSNISSDCSLNASGLSPLGEYGIAIPILQMCK